MKISEVEKMEGICECCGNGIRGMFSNARFCSRCSLERKKHLAKQSGIRSIVTMYSKKLDKLSNKVEELSEENELLRWVIHELNQEEHEEEMYEVEG